MTSARATLAVGLNPVVFLLVNSLVVIAVIALAPQSADLLGLVLVAPIIVIAGHAIVTRPQLGVLALAALLPFDGLLALASVPDWVQAWKEVLLLGTLAATFVAPARARAFVRGRPPSWWPVVLVFAALALFSMLLHPGFQGIVGLKVTFFWVLLGVVVWRCPLDARERDRLVGILMLVGAVTAAIGIGQQLVGAERLAQIGWEYNENIRFAGGTLRSFATFNQNFPFALFLMVVLLLCLPSALTEPNRARNRWFFFSIPLLLVAMAFTISRAPWIGLVVGVLYLGATRFRAVLAVVARVALVALVALIAFGGLATTYLSVESSRERVEIWESNLTDITSYPFGQGIGATGSAAEKASELEGTTSAVLQPDNYYFKVALELGVLGLWVLILLFVTTFSAAHTAAGLLGSRDAAFARGTAAMVLAAATVSLSATYFEVFPLDAYFWLALGVVAACVRDSA